MVPFPYRSQLPIQCHQTFRTAKWCSPVSLPPTLMIPLPQGPEIWAVKEVRSRNLIPQPPKATVKGRRSVSHQNFLHQKMTARSKGNHSSGAEIPTRSEFRFIFVRPSVCPSVRPPFRPSVRPFAKFFPNVVHTPPPLPESPDIESASSVQDNGTGGGGNN